MASEEREQTTRTSLPRLYAMPILVIALIGMLLLAWRASENSKGTDDCPDPSSSDRLCVGEIVCSQTPGTAPVMRPDANNNCPSGWHQNVVQPDAVCFLALELAKDPFDRYATCSEGCEDKGTVRHTAFANRCCTGTLVRVCKPQKKRWF